MRMAWDDGLTGVALNIAGSDESPLRVLAGPGTGKTYAMKRRVMRLLEEGGVPQRILPARSLGQRRGTSRERSRSLASRVRNWFGRERCMVCVSRSFSAMRCWRQQAGLLGHWHVGGTVSPARPPSLRGH